MSENLTGNLTENLSGNLSGGAAIPPPQKSSLGLIWDFLKVRKKWWLTPIVLFSLLLGLLIVLTQGSAVAPFIYTLF
jgi:uncharacterized membrane protein SpoIIM required for sporulation